MFAKKQFSKSDLWKEKGLYTQNSSCVSIKELRVVSKIFENCRFLVENKNVDTPSRIEKKVFGICVNFVLDILHIPTRLCKIFKKNGFNISKSYADKLKNRYFQFFSTNFQKCH